MTVNRKVRIEQDSKLIRRAGIDPGYQTWTHTPQDVSEKVQAVAIRPLEVIDTQQHHSFPLKLPHPEGEYIRRTVVKHVAPCLGIEGAAEPGLRDIHSDERTQYRRLFGQLRVFRIEPAEHPCDLIPLDFGRVLVLYSENLFLEDFDKGEEWVCAFVAVMLRHAGCAINRFLHPPRPFPLVPGIAFPEIHRPAVSQAPVCDLCHPAGLAYSAGRDISDELGFIRPARRRGFDNLHAAADERRIAHVLDGAHHITFSRDQRDPPEPGDKLRNALQPAAARPGYRGLRAG